MGRLDGKVCAITGAASGIGRGAAGAFAREGAQVALIDRNADALEETVSELGQASFGIPADVSLESDMQAAFAAVVNRYDRLDVLYACAAVYLIGEDAPVHHLSLETWDRTHAVNLRGMFLTCKYAALAMIEAGNGGSIITCGSPNGLTMCGAGFHAYSASKGGVMSLTRVMAADLAGHGIRVNGVMPGSVYTSLTKPMLDDPEIKARVVAGHPIGRNGTTDDINGIAVFLASDESSFATGAHFFIDGGISVR